MRADVFMISWQYQPKHWPTTQIPTVFSDVKTMTDFHQSVQILQTAGPKNKQAL